MEAFSPEQGRQLNASCSGRPFHKSSLMEPEGNTTLNARPTATMKQSLTKPIFIVGLPRTGSKLLMNMINNNLVAGCHIANEVQFFGHSWLGRILQGRRGIMPIIDGARSEDGKVDWDRVIDNLYSGKAKGVHWHGVSAGWLHIPRNKLLESLSATDGTPRSIYEAILVTQEKEYSVYGDKSGPNLYFVDKLVRYFPDAKILHIIRDPRAIVTSQHLRLLSILQHKSRSSATVLRIKQALLGPIVALYILTVLGLCRPNRPTTFKDASGELYAGPIRRSSVDPGGDHQKDMPVSFNSLG